MQKSFWCKALNRAGSPVPVHPPCRDLGTADPAQPAELCKRLQGCSGSGKRQRSADGTELLATERFDLAHPEAGEPQAVASAVQAGSRPL